MTTTVPAIDRRVLLASGAVLLVAGPASASPASPDKRKDERWPVYGATNAATKYSPAVGGEHIDVAGENPDIDFLLNARVIP